MVGNSKGLLENISWGAIIGAIATAIGLIFGLPEYVLNIRPQIEAVIGAYSLSFGEGTLFGTIITVLVLKAISDRNKAKKEKEEVKQEKKPSYAY